LVSLAVVKLVVNAVKGDPEEGEDRCMKRRTENSPGAVSDLTGVT